MNKISIHKAQVVGAFFLLAFLAYGLGRQCFESEQIIKKYIGALLIIINSVMIFFIGMLFSVTLKQCNLLVAKVYFFTRIIEALALASIIVNLIPSISFSYDHGYFFAMLVLGIGSIPMCLCLYKYNVVPSWLALWGVIGYTIFSFGFLMELFGLKWSMHLLIVGGLWEITFALWLILKRRKN